MNFKCAECGNTFKKEVMTRDQIIICAICETQYKVVVSTDGKIRLEDTVFNGSDPGEL